MKMSGLLSGTAMSAGSGVGPRGFVDNSDQEETPNVSPEEQSQYDMFVKNGMELLYRKDGTIEPEVLKRLSTGKKPIDTLAQTAVWLVMMLEQSAKQKGQDISDDVIMHGGRELLEQLADVDSHAGIHDFQQAELQGAWYNALDMYRESNSEPGDRFKPEEAAGAFEALNEADKEGRADEVVPGFYQQSERAITTAQQDQPVTDDQTDEGGDKKVLSAKSRGLLNG